MINQAYSAVKDEVFEAYEELRILNMSSFIKEMFDVWHTIIVAISMSVAPTSVLQSRDFWIPIFFLSGVVSPMKQGERYR
jgi:hypothetical protein